MQLSVGLLPSLCHPALLPCLSPGVQPCSEHCTTSEPPALSGDHLQPLLLFPGAGAAWLPSLHSSPMANRQPSLRRLRVWAKKRHSPTADRSCLVCSWRRHWSAASPALCVAPAVPVCGMRRAVGMAGSDLDSSRAPHPRAEPPLSPGCTICLGQATFLRFNHPAEAKWMKSMIPAGGRSPAALYRLPASRWPFFNLVGLWGC